MYEMQLHHKAPTGTQDSTHVSDSQLAAMYLVWQEYGHFNPTLCGPEKNSKTLSLQWHVNFMEITVFDHSDIPWQINTNNTINGTKVWKQHSAVLTAGMEPWYCAVATELSMLWAVSSKLCGAQNDVNARVSCHWLTELPDF